MLGAGPKQDWWFVLLLLSLGMVIFAAEANAKSGDPVLLIFDTDIGNDIDDALALGVIHALSDRDECRLLAVTITKDHPDCAAFVDLVNTFYGRGDIPIGVVRDGKTPKQSRYISEIVAATDGEKQRFPHDLKSGNDAPEAVGLLRKVLSSAPDRSVVMVVVGFSTNIARLLDSRGDAYSDLPGRELVRRKCRLLSIMAGTYGGEHKGRKEYNIFVDLPAAQKIYKQWPTPIVASGWEIGQAIQFPAVSMEEDFGYVDHHPLAEAYPKYQKMPYDRAMWDLTSVLYAVRPDRGYFGISKRGVIHVNNDAESSFEENPQGNHRYLSVNDERITRVQEALIELVTQPPHRVP